MLRTDGTEALIITGTNFPESSLLSPIDFQALAKYEQSVIALGKRVPEIGTGARAVITITHFTVTEMHHEVILVDYS